MSENADNRDSIQPGTTPPQLSTPAGLPKTISNDPLFKPVPEEKKKNREKKTWKEYFFEFVLVFTAVVLGFTADSFRENLEDKQKERKYMRSLISDINGDYTLSGNLEASILRQVKQIDSLQTILVSNSLEYNTDSILKCYRLSSCLLTFYAEFFNERTINQLLSSGSMRLIKDQDIADSIMAYHSFIKFLDVQRQLYINSINNCSQTMYDIYDISFLRSAFNKNGVLDYIPIDLGKLKLRTTNPDELKKFIAILENSKLIANNYMDMMGKMAVKADRLYTFLSKEYD
jgi:hypothetical protein